MSNRLFAEFVAAKPEGRKTALGGFFFLSCMWVNEFHNVSFFSRMFHFFDNVSFFPQCFIDMVFPPINLV